MSKKFITTDNVGRVTLIHNMPFDKIHGLGKTEAELEQIGFLIEEIPEPAIQEAKIPVGYYTKERGFWYEYEDAPKPTEQQIAEMQEQLEATQEALDFLLMNGGN